MGYPKNPAPQIPPRPAAPQVPEEREENFLNDFLPILRGETKRQQVTQ